MKYDDAPKVVVWVYSNNIVSEFFKIGEFSGMVELNPHAVKFGFSNLVPRILLLFSSQTQPKSSIGTVCTFASLRLRFPSKLRCSQGQILFVYHRIHRNCRLISSVNPFSIPIGMEVRASQNEDVRTHGRDHGGRSGSLVAVRVDRQAVCPGSPNATDRGRLFFVPTAAASAPHPNLNLQMLAQAVVVGKGDTVEEREAAGNNTWGGDRGR